MLLHDLRAGACFDTHAPQLRTAGANCHAGFRVREFEDILILQVGVGCGLSPSLAGQIEDGEDWPDRVEGAGVAALERQLARPGWSARRGEPENNNSGG